MNLRPCLALGLLAPALVACSDRPVPPKVPVPVRVAAATMATPGGGVRYSGNVEPRVRVDLAFKVGGYIAEVRMVRGEDGASRPVQDGDKVRSGDVLCRVSDANYRVKLDQALGGLGQAQAALANAQRDFDRARELRQNGAVPQAVLDGATAKLDGTRAAVAYARGLVDEARVYLADTALKAPIDGTVMKRLVEVGSLVGPGVGGFVLADTTAMKVVFGVPDAALERFPMGARVPVRLDALRLQVDGRVTRVSPFADPRTRVFDVEVTIPNDDGRVKAGMIAALAGPAPEAPAVPVVPLSAVVRPPGAVEGYAVFVVEGAAGTGEGDGTGPTATARARRIRIGEVRGASIEVADGLAAGERVVVSGASFLTDGEAVTVVP